MEEKNNNWYQSVTAVVLREGRVLLARHTYGPGKGMLIVPGGYVQFGESPQEAVKREYMEETGVVIEPREIIGIRFSDRDWYVCFAADYISGTARTDGDENDEVLWLPAEEALERSDVPDLTKQLILCAQSREPGLSRIHYESRHKGFLYGCT